MEEIKISHETNYQSSVATAINRRTNFKVENGKLITQHSYTIGKKNYLVNSIFDIDNRLTVADGVKRLIDNELNSAA